jgi:CheY-like chemotaxis protein
MAVSQTPLRVVIAEDEALIRLDLKEMLEEEGYEVAGEAADGEKAVELASALRPDLVILDVKMPVPGRDLGGRADRGAADRPGGDPDCVLPARSARLGVARRGRPGRRRRGRPAWGGSDLRWPAALSNDSSDNQTGLGTPGASRAAVRYDLRDRSCMS